jgi:uncharacterized protein
VIRRRFCFGGRKKRVAAAVRLSQIGRMSVMPFRKPGPPTIDERLAALDWPQLAAALDRDGYAATGPLLTPDECAALTAAYGNAAAFRSKVVMARHGFGRGEYQYFAYPLPDVVQGLRAALYPRLAPIASAWNRALKREAKFPGDLKRYLESCHAAGQKRPTPLLLKYEAGDYNCLHRDLYGDLVFPLQATVLLSEPEADFTGGEFVLTEQRPRMQSRAAVVNLARGEGVIFTVNERPVAGTRGTYRVAMRHGVSVVRSGRRFTLGVIFHDAR